MTSTDWRATWEAAKAAIAEFPSFTDATEPGQERPDESWFHGIAAAEIAEVEARHAMQRAELEASPDPVGNWTLGVLRAACTAAIATVADSKQRAVLTARLTDSLRLYGLDDAEPIDMDDRYRVEFMMADAGVRAAMPGATDQARQRVTDRLQAAIADGLEHPDELAPAKPVSPDAHLRSCAFARCPRGVNGRPALFVPAVKHSGQKFCTTACRKGDARDRAKSDAAQGAEHSA